jgi:hypothetical protein
VTDPVFQPSFEVIRIEANNAVKPQYTVSELAAHHLVSLRFADVQPMRHLSHSQ